MKSSDSVKVVFIGAGNIATHLAVSLNKKGFKIIQVFSRTKKTADILAKKVDARSVSDLGLVSEKADLYVISVSDDALPVIASKLKLDRKFIVHTSGFHKMNLLKNVSERVGVIYPLQTFSKNRKVDLSNVPFCIEAANKKDERLLMEIAGTLSSDVRCITSEERRIIHLAAVFACNFTNYLYSVADKILEEKNISFDILKPLILETARKILSEKPFRAQTGPARRGDRDVLKKHMAMIRDNDLRKLYALISKQISKEKKS